MQIAICDDIQKELKMIRTALDAYAKGNPQYNFDIDEYRAAEDVLNAVEKGKMYDIALMDICRKYGGDLDYKIEKGTCSACAVLNL